MAKDKLIDYSATNSLNTDVGSINIDEGMLPSDVNNAIREVMTHLKDFAEGTQAINQIKVDNIQIDANTISSTNLNGNITITPNGTGDVVIDGLKHPQSDGTSGQFLKTDGLGQLSFSTITQATGNELENVVEDTTPQLGGDLDTNGNDITFGDNDKAIFGAGSDLQIYHDGSNSKIQEIGTGNLFIDTTDALTLRQYSTNSVTAKFVGGGASELYHNNSKKMETTSSGCVITGNAKLSGTGSILQFDKNGSGTDNVIFYDNSIAANNLYLGKDSSNIIYRTGGSERMRITSGGNVGIGESSPSLGSSGTGLHITGASNKDGTLKLDSSTANYSGVLQFTENGTDQWRIGYDATNNHLEFTESGVADRMVIADGGNVGIGTTSPAHKLEVAGTITADDNLYIAGAAVNIDLDETDTTDKNTRMRSSGSGFFIQTLNDAKTAGTNRMKIDHTTGDISIYKDNGSTQGVYWDASSGDLLVGKTTTDIATAGHVLYGSGVATFTRDGSAALRLNRLTSDGEILDIKRSGTTLGTLGAHGGDLYVGHGDTTLKFYAAGDAILPRGTDGAARNGIIDLGNAGSKFNDIFATNGTIQTSDESEKQQIASLTDAEITAAKAISALFKTFKWNDSVASKGDAARTHTGVIAQQVEQALTNAGLNAGDYAFFINGTWTDDDGVEQSSKGIRYAELLSFIGAATEQRLSNIESRLSALEAN